MIVALGHRKGVGKDTVGAILVNKCQQLGIKSTCFSFAQRLKEMAYMTYDYAGVKIPEYYAADYSRKNEYLPHLGMTYRDLLIKLGCKMREIHPDTWIAPVLYDATRFDIAVVTDLRFPNEMELVRAAGGLCFKVTRSVVIPTDDAADIALEGDDILWDGEFKNDYETIKELEEVVAGDFLGQILPRLNAQLKHPS